MQLKDDTLNELAHTANVAQFVSLSPDLEVRHLWIRGIPGEQPSRSYREAIGSLLAMAPEGTVNIRSFAPGRTTGQPFFYGLRAIDEIVAVLQRLAAEGLYTIVNETVDVEDGGVSGVAFGGAVEFAPGDTPRSVEKPGVASFPWDLGYRLLSTVYGFQPAFGYEPDVRLEFSVHPVRRGYLNDHTIVWEREHLPGVRFDPEVIWPNRFSRWLGDKVFGLVVSAALGLPVPRTTVIARRVAPFTFGESTGTAEPWIRTSPPEQDPGRFTTQRGWLDPFHLLLREDADGSHIASVAAQEGVNAEYSGALLTDATGNAVLEGTVGFGEAFMLGQKPSPLPDTVRESVVALYHRATAVLGPVRFEWVFDGRRAWIVQLHRGASPSQGLTIYPGNASAFRQFDVATGIDALRVLIHDVRGTGEGVVLIGDVGVTSHLADLLRRARIPSRIEREIPTRGRGTMRSERRVTQG